VKGGEKGKKKKVSNHFSPRKGGDGRVVTGKGKKRGGGEVFIFVKMEGRRKKRRPKIKIINLWPGGRKEVGQGFWRKKKKKKKKKKGKACFSFF